MPRIPAWVKTACTVLLLVLGARAGVLWRYGVTIHNATESAVLVNGLGVQWQIVPPDGEVQGWQLPLLDRVVGGLESPAILRAWAAGALEPDAEIIFCQDAYQSEALDRQGRRIDLVRGHLDPHAWSCPRPNGVYAFPHA
jgi:hypothetical protein